MFRPTHLRIGVHTSIANGLALALTHAKEIGCDAVQIFGRNPRGWRARPLDRVEVRQFRKTREQTGLWPLAVHSVYLINLAAEDRALLERSRAAFREELERAIALRADCLVVHPGNPRGMPAEAGIATAIESIRESARGLKLAGAADSPRGAGMKNKLTILIENTAGQGSSIGCNFFQVADIIAGLDDLPVDVCLDTAHTLASGYDISTAEGLRSTVRAIERSFGFSRLRLIHCNDSRVGLGKRVDRHEHIGLGCIGAEGFRRFTHNLKFRRVPFILETPQDSPDADKRNLARIRELSGE
jgi:deoxyribonuclease IV